jgi:hypothetical protein
MAERRDARQVSSLPICCEKINLGSQRSRKKQNKNKSITQDTRIYVIQLNKLTFTCGSDLKIYEEGVNDVDADS